jgi:N-methylhydantoinase B
MDITGHNLQILINHCVAAADAMAYTIVRTAHSTFVKETEDFTCTILDVNGQAIASSHAFGAPWVNCIDYGPVLKMIDDYEPGDICITNDPYSGNVSTHTPDVHIWKPVFYDGEIVCFVGGHIHNTDVGGAVPASLSKALNEVVQEGLRIPPVKIIKKGKINEEVASIMRLNVRVPDQNWGDFNAQIASVNIGERKIVEIVERFGLEGFREGIEAMLDYAHRQAQNAIRTIPNGEYFFADYADDDGCGTNPCRIALTLRVFDDSVELDYSGSDPQLSSSLNMPTGGHERHCLVLIGLMYVLTAIDPAIIPNAGTLRAARAILPKGSVVNCEAPAAVGMRSLTCVVTQSATFGAFAQAIPDRLPASAAGGIAIVNVKTFDRDGKPVMASIGPVSGGGGGTPTEDGAEGLGGAAGFLRNTPVEVNELEVPIRFLRYGLWGDTAECGPGDVIRAIGSGAGGYGDPFTRDTELVLRDVQQGFVSSERAESDYGVVVANGEIDVVATEKLREGRASASSEDFFDFGTHRNDFERTWTRERYSLLSEFLTETPVIWRQFAKDQMFAAVATMDGNEGNVVEQMRGLGNDLTDRYPAIRTEQL